MGEAATGLWMFGVFVVMLNGCAAGIAAALHTSRRKAGRGRKITMAAAATGLLVAGMILPFALSDPEWGTARGPLIITLALAVVFLLGAVVSVPGALVVVRKLEQPGDEYRAFE